MNNMDNNITDKNVVAHSHSKKNLPIGQFTTQTNQVVTTTPSRQLAVLSHDELLRNSTMSALPAILTGLGILALFVGGLVFWIVYVPLHSAVHAPAEIIFKSKRQSVQHLEGGIVKKILVKDGDTVQAGQALVILEGKQVQPIVNMLDEQNAAERAYMARLEAESKNARHVTFPGSVSPKIRQTEENMFNIRRESFEQQVELLRLQISQIKETIKGHQDRLATKNQEIALIREQLDANQSLLKDGYVTRTIILDLQRQLAANTGDRESIVAAIAGEKQRIAEFEQRIIALKVDRGQGAVSELKQSALRRIEQEERVRPMRDILERQVIRAPVTGKVVGLKVSTIGGVVQPREPLMEIAPSGDELILEAKIELKDVTDIRIGQEADVVVAGFDARKIRFIRARVTYISDDRIKSLSAQEKPYYLAYLEFLPESLKILGDVKLIPGMAANVSIATAPRSTFDYIVEPMRNRFKRALEIKNQ